MASAATDQPLPHIDETLGVPELNEALEEAQQRRSELNQWLRDHQQPEDTTTTEYRDKFREYQDLKWEIQALIARIETLADLQNTGGVFEVSEGSDSTDDDAVNMPNTADKNPGGADLNAIPSFNGDGKVDAELWLTGFKTAAKAFQWKEEAHQQMAAMKLIGDAAIWLDGESKMRNFPCQRDADGGYSAWEVFEKMFLGRWKPQQEPLQATEAIMNLRQASGEAVLTFLDRVVLSVEKKNWQATDRTAASYIAMRDADLFNFGAAGIRTDIRKVILSNPKPPATFKELKAAAVNAETALRAQHTINEIDAMETGEQQKEEVSEIALLKKEIETLKANNIVCYKCGQRGHIRKNCKSQGNQGGPRQGQRGGRGRGRGQQRRPQGRRGGGGRGGGYQAGQGWNSNYSGWQPQANFGQPGSYYQREITQSQAPGGFAYQMGPPPTPHQYPEHRVNTLVEEPWMFNASGN